MLTAVAVRAVGPPAFASGFALAGIPADETTSLDDGVARLEALLDDRTLGVVLADEALVRALPDAARRRSEKRPTPVLVPVPRARWEGPSDEAGAYILDLLQRAVGYRLRLR